eukprot:SAG31_NODE_102_length_25175_cov_10.778553_2_plen_87_part_00
MPLDRPEQARRASESSHLSVSIQVLPPAPVVRGHITCIFDGQHGRQGLRQVVRYLQLGVWVTKQPLHSRQVVVVRMITVWVVKEFV